MTAAPALGVRAFLASMIGAWIVFHGAPLLGLEFLPFGDLFPTREYGAVAALALAAVLAGFVVAAGRGRAAVRPAPRAEPLLSHALGPTALFLKITAVPLVLACAVTALRTARVGYRDATTVPLALNLVLYACLTLLPVVLWSRDRLPRRAYWTLLAVLVAPRLTISLTGPRFFVLQALLPIAFWEAAHLRGRVPVAKLASAAVLAYGFLFHLVPALRSDGQSGFHHLVLGSPITLLPQLERLRLLEVAGGDLVACEIVAGATGLDACGLRERFGIPDDVDPRLDRAATHFTREITGYDAIGTGGNPLLEAFPELEPDGNLAWFVLIGATCGVVLRRMRESPVCCFLLPHVAAKGLFFWRGTVSEFFDRAPMVLAAYAAVLLVAALVGRPACER